MSSHIIEIRASHSKKWEFLELHKFGGQVLKSKLIHDILFLIG
ncbi:hypothetical protein LEP1GSC034_0726 [Leptospira interrogans str. 2003000735]|uniref:Uncharacterized protein n=2 Tax=Leptospira interrogans TaxID=173 RepID=A0A0E2D0W0_LEPIR|nr:hypothetical protein [Leptospira interrogans]EKO25078.1 hypothetical protein LEP1GSC104_0307 [Leptospira interrogans str. UI 12621]EKP21786.1 hypothetical protein LEP1GSC117_0027 [Leptospira interrogans serovar Icterohaemorrhagiae str. Verdun LP]EKP75160.1 hypothetical protein LEP1GSC173_0187 [Leptospira interrogans str. HAI1594]EKR37986.1 hypothetical protein LEP1GSC096_2123 [Leptospira interrogans serovar Hebdomadis str. R499]EKR53659.1 hypothetical protein LEP1GSC105_0511 [Leptospira int